MRLFGHVCSRRSTMPEDKSVESELSGSDDGEDVDSDDGHASGVQWSGSESGSFTAGVMAEENSVADDW